MACRRAGDFDFLSAKSLLLNRPIGKEGFFAELDHHA
jgi:hypothetical protein